MPAVPGTPIRAKTTTDSSSSWCTPKWLLDRLRGEVFLSPIALDPCTNSRNNVGALQFFTAEDDGLTKDWNEWVSPHGAIFVNPPFVEGRKWAIKTIAEARARKAPRIVFLAPAAIGTSWIHAIWKEADDALWLGTRLRFTDEDGKLLGSPTRGTVLFSFNCTLRRLADLGTRAVAA